MRPRRGVARLWIGSPTFTSGYAAGYARWLAEHPADHPDTVEVRALAERQRAAYFAGYRGVLGLGYLELLAV